MMLAAILVAVRPTNLLALPGIGMALGLYWFYKGFRLLQRKRLIQNTPASKIRSASMGLVEISGLASGPYVLTSPFRQAESYYYRSTAWQLKQRGKNTQWVKVAEEVLHVPFYLDDNTAKVLIDPRGAEMDLHCDLSEQYHRSVLFSGPEMPGPIVEFLIRHGVDPDKRIKVEEYCIKPKNFLFVLGTLSQNPGLDASIRPTWAEPLGQKLARAVRTEPVPPVQTDSVPPSAGDPRQQVIRLSNASAGGNLAATGEMTQQQKIAAALLKAGISNPAAWSAAGMTAQATGAAQAKTASVTEPEAQPETAAAERFDLHPPVVLMQGSHQPAFFISWRSQRDVVRSLGWKSSLMIWGGPALTLISVYFLLVYFDLL
jgi:E3 Ubiquitin ligase